MYTTVVVFILLSLASIVISGAPLRVHAVNISALLIAFVIPSLISKYKANKKQIYIWLFGGIIGLLYWDVLSAFVIVKREIFVGWYIVYPAGIVAILFLQTLVKYINSKLPYNKSLNQIGAENAPPG